MKQMNSLFAWFGRQEWIGKLIRIQAYINPAYGPAVWTAKLANLFGTGKGGDLQADARSRDLPGAMLEGSVEAYSAVQRSLVNYAKQTADNTKRIADQLWYREITPEGNVNYISG
jgi:hypothetical protein